MDILSGLVEVSFWHFDGFRKVFLNVAYGVERPPNEVAGLDRLDPCGLYRVAAHDVHPFDGLFHGG